MFEKDLEILKTAIINEQEGHQFYLMAAEKSDNADVKEVFLNLAADEKDHESWLRTVYRGIIEKGQPGELTIDEFSRSPEIFSANKLKNAGGLTVSALHVGFMLEKDSMDFYRRAAEQTDEPELKKLLEALAKWENKHLDTLEKAYDIARDDWWEHQGFSTS